MREKLETLIENAYAPYSKFKVAAYVECTDGQIFSGVNVENVSNGASRCAEQNAITKAVGSGKRRGDFVALHLMGSSGEELFPCGICQQVMGEFYLEEAKIFIYSKDKVTEYILKDLEPHPFRAEDLK